MAIRFVTGKPGAGKGLLCMKLICEELATGSRPVLTNLAVELLPWVSGSGKPQLGLLAYMRYKHGKTFDAESRVFRLDEAQAAAFYLWRVKDGVLTAAAITAERDVARGRKKAVMEFDTALIAESGPHFYVIDEAWQFWGSRNWQETGEGLQFYQAQHRKAGDDLIICTQHTKQIDTAIQRLAQDFWVVRNRSLLRIGPFRQPDNFKVAVFESAPTGAVQTPMHTQTFPLDIKGIAQTYDTAAGVGLADRMVADGGKKRKGLPWTALLIGVPLFGIFAGLFFAKGLGSGVKHMFGGSEPAKKAPVGTGTAPAPGPGPGPTTGSVAARVSGPGVRAAITNVEVEVRVCGSSIMGNRGKVLLTDGSLKGHGTIPPTEIVVYFVRDHVRDRSRNHSNRESFPVH